jgi:hypothetical protein
MTNERTVEGDGRSDNVSPDIETGDSEDPALLTALVEVDELLPLLGRRPAPPDLIERVLARLAVEPNVDVTKQELTTALAEIDEPLPLLAPVNVSGGKSVQRIVAGLVALAAAAAAAPIGVSYFAHRSQDASSSQEAACRRQYPNGLVIVGDTGDPRCTPTLVKISSIQAAHLAVTAAINRFSGTGYEVIDSVLTTQIVESRYFPTWTVFLNGAPQPNVHQSTIPSVMAIVNAEGGQVTVTRLQK